MELSVEFGRVRCRWYPANVPRPHESAESPQVVSCAPSRSRGMQVGGQGVVASEIRQHVDMLSDY